MKQATSSSCFQSNEVFCSTENHVRAIIFPKIKEVWHCWASFLLSRIFLKYSTETQLFYMREGFEVLKAMFIKSTIFWDTTGLVR
jgi:hypothetical protein